MKVKYEFVTGESVEIEVPDNIGEVSIELDRQIYNSDHKETRRHKSIENLQAQGNQLADGSPDIPSIIERKEMSQALHNALEKLLPQQRELIQKVYFEGRPLVDIAREEGVDKSAISHRLKRIYVKLRNLN